MAISKIVVDLRSRTFSVEVPDDKLDAILDRLELMLNAEPVSERAEPQAQGRDSSSTTANSGERVETPLKPKKRVRGAGASGKTKSLAIVDIGLDEAGREELRRFFSEKQPKGQGEQVAVLGSKLAEMTAKRIFSGDEIHSALKIVNQPTPKNLTAVFGNMKRDALGDYKGTDLVVNHFTDDYVKFKLPKAASAKK